MAVLSSSLFPQLLSLSRDQIPRCVRYPVLVLQIISRRRRYCPRRSLFLKCDSHAPSFHISFLSSCATKRVTHLILNASTGRCKCLRKPVFTSRHTVSGGALNCRRQERSAKPVPPYPVLLPAITASQAAVLGRCTLDHLRISTDSVGGPATVGLTQLWRKATERLPVPW